MSVPPDQFTCVSYLVWSRRVRKRRRHTTPPRPAGRKRSSVGVTVFPVTLRMFPVPTLRSCKGQRCLPREVPDPRRRKPTLSSVGKASALLALHPTRVTPSVLRVSASRQKTAGTEFRNRRKGLGGETLLLFLFNTRSTSRCFRFTDSSPLLIVLVPQFSRRRVRSRQNHVSVICVSGTPLLRDGGLVRSP